MVVDTSALIAILRNEPEQSAFRDLLEAASDPIMSAVTWVEASMVMAGRSGLAGQQVLDDFITDIGIRVVSVDVANAEAARRAFLRYGKGRSPAGLNFGDCFAYALSRITDRPLLFKGSDFSHTDVTAAL